MTLGERTQNILNAWAEIATKQPQAIAEFDAVYLEIFGETVTTGCGSCYQKAFHRVQRYATLSTENQTTNLKTMSENLKERKFLLKSGIVLQAVFGSDPVTNDNLTDEQAEEMLKANPNFAAWFDRMPDEFLASLSKQPEAADVPEFSLGLGTDVSTVTPENAAVVSAPVTAKRSHKKKR